MPNQAMMGPLWCLKEIRNLEDLTKRILQHKIGGARTYGLVPRDLIVRKAGVPYGMLQNPSHSPLLEVTRGLRPGYWAFSQPPTQKNLILPLKEHLHGGHWTL
jgi:hypothetical protein